MLAREKARTLTGGRGCGAQELVGRKKTIHLDCFDIRLDSLERKLVATAEEDRAKARYAADSERNRSGGPYTLRRLIDRIASLAREVRERHAARPPEDYADEATFKRLVQASRRRGARGDRDPRPRSRRGAHARGLCFARVTHGPHDAARASAWPGSGRAQMWTGRAQVRAARRGAGRRGVFVLDDMHANTHARLCAAPPAHPLRASSCRVSRAPTRLRRETHGRGI